MTPIDPAEAATEIGADEVNQDNGLEMLAWMLLSLFGATVLIGIVTIATIFF
jgi:hypothetical protein